MKENGESMNFIFLFLKSIVIGFFMLVPGISGGSIAILLNIYDDLLLSLNNIFKTFKSSVTF
jgi:putative membrane protein